ncbi:MAG TPA: TlpA disulfide reductase family protein [Chloroflexota bacterium]
MTCNADAPVWERVYKEWKGKGIEFVGIGLLDSREKSADFPKRHGLTFPNGWDGDGTIARAYGFTHQPYWAAIAKDGALVKTGFGPRGEQELVTMVKTLLGQ